MGMKELLEYVAKNLVEHPESVSVAESEREDGELVLTLRVADGDIGMIIGRGGRIIREIRTLLRAAAARANRRVTVEVAD
jgi:predicted RNA-binding protein YlqC (UPF0109 family)